MINLFFFVFQERRPYLSSECDDLPKAEKWRRQIIGEISRKVAQIQNGMTLIIINFNRLLHYHVMEK